LGHILDLQQRRDTDARASPAVTEPPRRSALRSTPALPAFGLRALLAGCWLRRSQRGQPLRGGLRSPFGLRCFAFGSAAPGVPFARERVRNLSPVGAVMSRDAHMRPEQTAAAQLRAQGIDPAEIELVVMTHLHFDHASALSDFPNATVLVEEREWRAAWARDRHLHGYSTAQLDPRLSYRTLDFSSPVACARDPFERTLDVFGDGSLTLASTPGHTVGHLSPIARLKGREALLTADAAYTLATIRDGARPWLTYDRGSFEHSLRQIQAYDREHPDAIVIPGHDMDAWNAACAQL
jgi:glyoxylase-like metal-dependent hydrolase (beta-lactamase superfamily II)